MKRYGYVRVSTMEQNIERQIKNIKALYPKAIIIQDEYTGTKMDRPEWSKLYSKLKKGDQVIFDSVSRMSRDAEEGFKVYQELYERGCDLVFLKEPHINTEAYREALKGSLNVDVKSGDQDTDDLINGIMKAVNTFMMAKVKADIMKAFDQAEKEVMDLRQRVKEGMAVTKENNERLIVKYGSEEKARKSPEWKELGRSEGDKLHIKKAEPIKELIRKYSRDFDGTLSDMELLGVLSTKTVKIPTKKRSGRVEEREISAKLSRNTLYKYKKEMKEEPEKMSIRIIGDGKPKHEKVNVRIVKKEK